MNCLYCGTRFAGDGSIDACPVCGRACEAMAEESSGAQGIAIPGTELTRLREIEAAAKLGAYFLAEWVGTCPLDQYNWLGCPVDDTGACPGGMSDCWLSWLQTDEARAELAELVGGGE